MTGITEPITKWYGALIWLTGIFTLVSAFHWIGEVDQELVDTYGEETTMGLLYNGEIRNVIGGMPDYIFATFMWYVVAIIFGIGATMQWTVNEEVPENKSNTQMSMNTSASNETEENDKLTATANGTEQTNNVEMTIDADI